MKKDDPKHDISGVHWHIETKQKKQENESPREDFVIVKIEKQKIKSWPRHRYVKAGKPLYYVR